ncbi:3-hydroxyacyl-[acyl-carrier-protein] dehydratase FabZ [Gimesia panareensis]|uniref:3-hydroxyacyl-[acyl-carrier-protein] dehydratase FabZ n=1 Tax=Gimesia panareensis TaxID=2527978 RepID=A0A518FXG9_9PLAN|nr:3-hydroxyacyl-ACP dehydratase FabZ family protein [Gimesia panareensis]QDV21079.1 3-hydroxyacyl-[acyl-carrier-protein] dehydratase FabZ [Gimesia panareensis]
MRFSLVDQILELEKGKSITAVKNLSLAEEYLQDHFPGFAVMPGVLMVESIVQAGAWLMRYTNDFEFSTILLKQTKAIRFNSFVTPGKQLRVSLSIQKWEDNLCTLKASSEVEGETAVSGRIVLEQFNLVDKNPSMAEKDAERIKDLQTQFAQLWNPAKQATT